jgi:hypothetical protein
MSYGRGGRSAEAAAADAVAAVATAALANGGPIVVVTGAGISTASGLPVYV